MEIIDKRAFGLSPELNRKNAKLILVPPKGISFR